MGICCDYPKICFRKLPFLVKEILLELFLQVQGTENTRTEPLSDLVSPACQLCGSALLSPEAAHVKKVGAAQAARTAGVDPKARCDFCRDAPLSCNEALALFHVLGQLGALLLVL